jgi:hypothetical protein
MSITISQQYAKIGIRTTPAKLEMESELPRILMKQKHAKVNIETDLPKVLIDQYQCFAEAGLKNIEDFTKETSEFAKQKLFSFIAKKCSDGRTLANIENGKDGVAVIAERDFIQLKQFGFGLVPKSRPKIEVTGGVRIQAEPNAQGITNGVKINILPGKLEINYQPSKVQIYEAQKAMLKIGFESDKKIDIKI